MTSEQKLKEFDKTSEAENTNVSSQFHGPVTMQANAIHLGAGNITKIEQIANTSGQSGVEAQFSLLSGIGQPKKILSEASLSRLIELSDSHMNDNKYTKALPLLKTILVQQKGHTQIPTLLKIIQCQVEIEQRGDALESLEMLESVIDSDQNPKLPVHLLDDCCNRFDNLVQKFIDIRLISTSMMLLQSLFAFIKLYFEGELRAHKLSVLGVSMEDIADEVNRQNKNDQFKIWYNFMDQILNEMNKIENSDLEFKCKKIAWFLKSYGNCCITIMDYNQAIAMNNQAIVEMKLLFGNNASIYRVFGYCHHNTGIAYLDLNHLEKALNYLEKALVIYEKASDWPTDERKKEELSIASTSLLEVEDLLKK